jgi:hypothetical protein
MASLRRILSISCILLLSASAWAQADKPEPVISHIPAGSMGFVVVPSIEAMTGKIDKFIGELGLGQMLSQPDPADANKMVQMPVLDMLKGAAQLGEGFNPKGGFAAVMLDLKAYDINLTELMGNAMGHALPAPDAAQETTQPKPEPKLPVVFFIPGKDVKSLLGAYNPEQAGKYMKVALPPGPMFAGQIGGYVMISPNDKALDAIAAATKMASSELPAEQLKAVSESDVAVCMNGKIAGPAMIEVMQLAEAQMSAQAGEMAPLLSTYFKIYREVLSQVDMVTLAGRFVQGGLVFEEMLNFQPESPYAKALAAAKLTGKADINALPNMPYVLALGAAGSTSPQQTQVGMDMINSLLLSQPIAGMPEDLKAAIKKSYQDANDQVTGIQFVGGGAPAGSGVFGLSLVIRCKDSAKMKDLLADSAGIAQGLIKHFGKDEPDANGIVVKYVKGIETVGQISADAIVVEAPSLEKMEEADRAEMKKVLGEDKIRVRVFATDKNTVVMTIGGSGAFFAEAVKAATSGATNKIGTDANSMMAMKHLPAERNMVALFNASNLYDVIVSGMKTMSPETEMPPFKITCKTPIAMGAGTTGKSAHAVVFIPTDLIKDVAGMVMMFTGGGGGGPGNPPPPMGDKDF